MFSFAFGAVLVAVCAVAAGLAFELAVFVCRLSVLELQAVMKNVSDTSVNPGIYFGRNIGSPFLNELFGGGVGQLYLFKVIWEWSECRIFCALSVLSQRMRSAA